MLDSPAYAIVLRYPVKKIISAILIREAYKIIKKRGAVGQEVLVWFGVKHGQPRSVIAVIVEMIDIMIHLDSERYGRVCAGAYKDPSH